MWLLSFRPGWSPAGSAPPRPLAQGQGRCWGRAAPAEPAAAVPCRGQGLPYSWGRQQPTPFHQCSAHPCSGGVTGSPCCPVLTTEREVSSHPRGHPSSSCGGECDPHVLGRGRWRRPTSVTAASHPAPCRESRPDPSWDHQPAPRVALRSAGYPRRPDPLKPGTGGVSQLPDHRRGTQPAALPPRVLAAAGGAARGSTAGGGGVLGSPPPPPALALGGLGLWGAHPAPSRAPRVCPCLCPRLAPALAPKPSVPAQEPPCRSGGAAPALSPARAPGKPLRAAPQRLFGGSLQPPGAPWDPSVPVC